MITSNTEAAIAAHSTGKQLPKDPKLLGAEGANDEDKDPNDIKDEPADFIETNCHWSECGREFLIQEDLVKVFDKLWFCILVNN